MDLPVKGYRNFLGGGRNWIILVFSLLLAFFMWSIMKLSASYSSYIRYSLEVTTNLEGRRSESRSTDVLMIGAKARGFNIIQHSNDNVSETLLIENVDPRHFHKYGAEGDMFYLLPETIKQRIQDAIGMDIKVDQVATDTLFFRFPLQSNKKVPVEANSLITYSRQYMPYTPILLKPDSVLVYGDLAVLSGIEKVVTQPIKSNNVSGSVTGVVQLKPVEGVRYSTDEIIYAQEVGRYVEYSLEVPVTIGNAPSYANVAIIPQEVTVKCRVAFPGAEPCRAQDFTVEVEYDEILRKDVVKPVVTRMPDKVLKISVEPAFVECVL